MIRPAAGVAFTLAEDGDLHSGPAARARVSATLGIPEVWATVRQVHGSTVVQVDAAGDHGEADAIFTMRPALPVAVFTADCLAVVLTGDAGVGVAHGGWRGLDQGVVAALREAMDRSGAPVSHCYVGPGIGPCCFEVGAEVRERFADDARSTTWGTSSVDLVSAARRQLEGVTVWVSGRCTMHQPGHHSHRGSHTPERMAAVAWLMRESDPGS